MNDDYESQWKGSPLAEVMGAKYRSRKKFYKEYVTSDYAYRTIGKIGKEQGLALINLSPYLEEANWRPIWEVEYENNNDPTSRIVDLMNKGAVPVGEERWEDGESSVWVYKHDDTWYLVAPPKTP